MSSITRCVETASSTSFDVIVVGGGVYGAMLMLEASKAGLRPLLLEKADFGGNTSINNLRIVHGGLRYLQSMHLSRFRESVRERQWFLTTFPDLVLPLPCVMPLYGQLSKNRLTLSTALALNDVLSRKRNIAVPASHQLPDGKLLSNAETIAHFPEVRQAGLKGGALWYDAVMPDCHRIVMETLRWSVAAGGMALNYLQVAGAVEHGQKVRGVVAEDLISGSTVEFRAPLVINAAGPECRALALKFHLNAPQLFRPSLAWNLLLNRDPFSAGAVAIQSPEPRSQVLFAHSHHGKLLLGTGHQPMAEGDDNVIAPARLQQMLNEVNAAVPGLDLGEKDILHVLQGHLPVNPQGSVQLQDEPVIMHHAQRGGLEGLYSVSGVKFTTARSTAESVIAQLMVKHGKKSASVRTFPQRPSPNPYRLNTADVNCVENQQLVAQLIASESPHYVEDLLLRRTSLALNTEQARRFEQQLAIALPRLDSRRIPEQ